MLGKTLTKQQVKALGLKPTGDIYGTSTEPFSWRYYQAPKIVAILRENVDGTFKVMACIPERLPGVRL